MSLTPEQFFKMVMDCCPPAKEKEKVMPEQKAALRTPPTPKVTMQKIEGFTFHG